MILNLRVRNRHFFFLDVGFLIVITYASFVLRLDRLNLESYWPTWLLFAGAATIFIPGLMRMFGLYAVFWRYASDTELMRILYAVTAGSGLVTVFAFATSPLWGVNAPPRSVPFIFFLLALLTVAAPRLLFRVSARRSGRRRRDGAVQKRVLIMGAGDAGEMLLREIMRSDRLEAVAVGFVDDDPSKQGISIHGVPVLGNREAIPALTEVYEVDQVIIAMPTAPGRDIREIVRICEAAGVDTKTMPGLYEILDGQVSVSQLRDVRIEDLLRREPVRTDIGAVAAFVSGRRVLVTGAGGSIGSEIARQLLRCAPDKLYLLGHGENSIFRITHELRALGTACEIVPVIADIRFRKRIQTAFSRYRPEIVFHAAAHKHVPLMQVNPCEAVSNNVLGTQTVLAASADTDVDAFVLISTDKAVNPTSMMGASKRVAEMLVVQKAHETGRHFVGVRFGNVLGSRGSVVLTFQSQIANGGPVTVTHPEMTRYFMTIPEAVQLVLQASVLGSGGDLFVLDMGAPVRIVDLARELIDLSGLQVGSDVDIVYSGVRPGEKMSEELFARGETSRRSEHDKIFVVDNAAALVPEALEQRVGALTEAARLEDEPAVWQHISSLLPEASFPGVGRSPRVRIDDPVGS